jgi:hypothetical protein
MSKKTKNFVSRKRNFVSAFGKSPELVSVFIGASGNLSNLLNNSAKKKNYKRLALIQKVLIYFIGFQKNGHLMT